MLRLYAEMVPQSTWQENVRAWLTDTQWKIVRTQIYALYGGRCAICHFAPPKGLLHCHEVWSYNDEKKLQTLVGFVALCYRCHNVKHLLCTETRAAEGRLDYQSVVDHFCYVNKCSPDDFYTHREYAYQQWKERSKYQWTVRTSIDLEHVVGKPLRKSVPIPSQRQKSEETSL